ncbi:DUF5085 family protein [Paenibacillaceae bacterium WGS1546]|uniref:DUF5085 family protein n=1 Tax=Cohnella sp. WGS1546 TaxID=3366810 RepID=UPI00372D3C6C
MKIKRSSLMFNNVIQLTTPCKLNEWDWAAREFRNVIIKNNLYATGPTIYQVADLNLETNEAVFTFCMPVNEPLQMPNNDKFGFEEVWHIPDGLLMRHADLDDDLEQSYEIVRACAEANDIRLQEPFYNIYLDVYGDGVIDIYAPILPEEPKPSDQFK